MPAHQLPEGYSYPLYLQQVVDLGVAQAIAQGFNRSGGAGGRCLYNGEDGRACHIGACLPLDVAKDWDRRGVVPCEGDEELPKFFAATSPSLAEFQAVHDYWLGPDMPGAYARKVKEFCTNHGLTFPEALAPYLTED